MKKEAELKEGRDHEFWGLFVKEKMPDRKGREVQGRDKRSTEECNLVEKVHGHSREGWFKKIFGAKGSLTGKRFGIKHREKRREKGEHNKTER